MAAGPFSALNIAAPVMYLRGRPPRAFKDGQKTISESRVGSKRFTWSCITRSFDSQRQMEPFTLFLLHFPCISASATRRCVTTWTLGGTVADNNWTRKHG